MNKNALLNEEYGRDDARDLNTLLHPAQAFEQPSDVVNDLDLTLNEKRAILASWASDACAIEAVSALRRPPGGKRPVLFDDVMDALRALDKQARQENRPGAYRGVVGRSTRGSSDQGRGHSLS
jgi:hypothetical protein